MVSRVGYSCLCGVILALAMPRAAVPQSAPEPITFDVGGAMVHGAFFRAPGPGLHPTLLLLHGYPGGPGDLMGLGLMATEMGWNALTFQPRGTHDSEGIFTNAQALEDAGEALVFLRTKAGSLGVDTLHVATIGYSAGGWLSIMTGIRHPEARCVAAIAPGNFGLMPQVMGSDSAAAAMIRAGYEAPIREGVVRAPPWEEASAEDVRNSEAFNFLLHLEALRDRPVLIIGGWRDPLAALEHYIVPVVRGLRDVGNTRVTPLVLDDDHSFRASREAIQTAVAGWLAGACAGI